MTRHDPQSWESLSDDELQDLLADSGAQLSVEQLRELLDIVLRNESLDGLQDALDHVTEIPAQQSVPASRKVA